ncbi:MAG: hypothetical protein HYV28_08215 [Ignavibacteriales bacterium]|nr:hypothetical protein [Ignavibacteriales bacterium]
MIKKLLIVIVLLLGISGNIRLNAQDSTESAIEIYLIESFIPVEAKTAFHLGFYTSEACKAKIIIAGKYEFVVSDTLTENHKAIIDIAKLPKDTLSLPFVLLVENAEGLVTTSEQYEVQIPEKDEKLLSQSGGGELSGCLYGAVIYAVPAVDYIFYKGKSSWGISKELPIISYYYSGYNFPTHYVSAEYSYIHNTLNKNHMRAGWKYLIDMNIGEFIVLGLNGVTDFRGYNGLSPELSWGLLSFNDVFTLYARYRYTTNFSETHRDHHTVSIGLYSWFFSVHK